MTSEEPPTWPETLAKAAVALLPEPLGGAAAAIIVGDVIVRKRAKAVKFLEDVTEGVDEGILRTRFAEDRVGTLVLNAGEVAVNTAVVEKRHALARVARNALTDDAKVDESELAVFVLARLEAPHIAALSRLEATYQSQVVDSNDIPDAGMVLANEDPAEGPMAERRRLAMVEASSKESQGVLAMLAGLGLITQNTTWGSLGTYDAGGLTELGQAVLGLLQATN